jgi:radical SAM superfamily enzyme
MKLIPVTINGKIHRLSERALELLGLERYEKSEPIAIQKLPPNLEIIKIQKKVPLPQEVAPVEVKKKVDVIVESTSVPKKKSNGRKVGVKK